MSSAAALARGEASQDTTKGKLLRGVCVCADVILTSQATKITEEFILMSEPDHIFLRPIPNLMRKDAWPAAYPFFYIEPAKVRDLNDLTRHRMHCITCSRPHTHLPAVLLPHNHESGIPRQALKATAATRREQQQLCG